MSKTMYWMFACTLARGRAVPPHPSYSWGCISSLPNLHVPRQSCMLPAHPHPPLLGSCVASLTFPALLGVSLYPQARPTHPFLPGWSLIIPCLGVFLPLLPCPDGGRGCGARVGVVG